MTSNRRTKSKSREKAWDEDGEKEGQEKERQPCCSSCSSSESRHDSSQQVCPALHSDGTSKNNPNPLPTMLTTQFNQRGQRLHIRSQCRTVLGSHSPLPPISLSLRDRQPNTQPKRQRKNEYQEREGKTVSLSDQKRPKMKRPPSVDHIWMGRKPNRR